MRSLPVLLTLAALAGCAVGPKYKRPDVVTPPVIRGDAAPSPANVSYGDRKWVELFDDAVLKSLVEEAVRNNYDVRIAAQRVLAAREQVTIQRAPMFPSVGGVASAEQQRGVNQAANRLFGGGQVSWELDLWGKIRRSTEAARGDYLAQEEVRHGILTSLIADVASGYFRLLQLDQELLASKQALVSRQESLKLTTAREQGGVGSMIEVDQSQTLVNAAQQNVTIAEREIEQVENFVSILLGRNPGPIDRGKPLFDQKLAEDVPAGLPSAILERRPDIRGAEQQLVAANARVGVAKSLFFPSIGLTAQGGQQNFSLGDIFKSTGFVYGFGGSVTQPLFNAGALWANYKASKDIREAAVLSYQQSVQQAFRDVSDSLVQHTKADELTRQRAEQANTLRDQLRLSRMRYEGGVASYLEVLDTEREALNAEIDYARAWSDHLVSLVQLYRALGGGWTL